MKIIYIPQFFRHYKKLPKELQKEVQEKIEFFRKDPNHPFLKVHKLKGHLKRCYSFSVNYRYRIVFKYLSKKEAVLLCVGDHEVYK